jgi:hypothetical protein
LTENHAEQTSVTKPSVFPGLGYPMHRQEESPNETGWRGSGKEDIEHVSRETLGEDD